MSAVLPVRRVLKGPEKVALYPHDTLNLPRKIDTHFTHPPEVTDNEGDGDPNWTSVFRAYWALQNLRRQREFDQAYETASQFLLHHTPLADIVLETGVRDRDWRWTDDAARIYRSNEDEFTQHMALGRSFYGMRTPTIRCVCSEKNAVGQHLWNAARECRNIVH